MRLDRPRTSALFVVCLLSLAGAAAAGDRPKGPRETEAAIESGLSWLARHQDDDGHWDAVGFRKKCGSCSGEGLRDFNVGLTALSLLSFVEAGYLPDAAPEAGGKSGSHGDAARRAVEWLIAQQDASGRFGPAYGELMYNHSIATYALAETLARTKAVNLEGPVKSGVAYLEKAQNPGLGWRYTPRPGNNDTSVTSWCVRALVSAKRAGLSVDDVTFTGAIAWIEKATQANGEVGYDKAGSGEIFVPGKNDAWAHHPTMTAAGMLVRCSAGDRQKGGGALAFGSRFLLEDLPSWNPSSDHPTVDYYYWHHGTLAMQAFEGPKGAGTKRWQRALLDALRPNQRAKKSGCAEGSWDAEAVDRWAHAGGRVYATSLNVLTLLASTASGGDAPEPAVDEPKAPEPDEDAKKPAPKADTKVDPKLEKALVARVKSWLQARQNLRCLRCRGKQLLPCPPCQGTGKVTVMTFGYGGTQGTKKCDRCAGEGKLRCCDDGLNKTKKKEITDKLGVTGEPIVDFVEKSLAVNAEAEGNRARVQHTVKYWGGESATETSTWEADDSGKWMVSDVAKN